MHDDRQEQLRTQFPWNWDTYSPDCGNGWFELILQLCVDIAAELNASPEDNQEPFSVLQVKEKLGGLRFYAAGHNNDKIQELISAAERKSYTICEICGAPGELCKAGAWLKTVCVTHQNREAEERPNYVPLKGKEVSGG